MNVSSDHLGAKKLFSFARPSQSIIDAARSQRKENRQKKAAERKQRAEVLRAEEMRTLLELRGNSPAFHPHRVAPVRFGPGIDAVDTGLWAHRSQLQEAFPGLMISNFFGARDAQKLSSHGVTHVLVCANELPEAHPHHFSYLKLIGLTDNTHTQLMPHLSKALPWIEQAISTHGRVLMHCASGMSRSGAILTAYLMWSQDLSLKDALTKAKESRPIVQPNPGFLEQLKSFEALKKLILKHTP